MAPPDEIDGEDQAEQESKQVDEQPAAEPEKAAGFLATLKAMKHALAPLGHKRVATATLAVAGLGLAGLIFFSGFSFWWTSQPSFCAKCHPMQKFVDAWEQGPHKEVTCEKCHLTPGLFGFIGGKIAGLQVVMNYVRGNYEDYSFNAAVGNASCLQCHEGILSQNIHTTGPMDVLVSHKDIIETGAKCMSCHSTTAHGDTVPVGSQTHPTMATCLQCHNDKIAPLRCSLCHVGKEAPSPGQPVPGTVTAPIPSEHPTVTPSSPAPTTIQGG